MRCVSASSRKRALFASSASVESVLIAASRRSSTRSALDGELRLRSCERTLELDDLLDASPALEKRGPHGDEDGERADRETDEKGSDDH